MDIKKLKEAAQQPASGNLRDLVEDLQCNRNLWCIAINDWDHEAASRHKLREEEILARLYEFDLSAPAADMALNPSELIAEIERLRAAVGGGVQPVGHVDMQSPGPGDRIRWMNYALPHGTPLYAAAPAPSDPAAQEAEKPQNIQLLKRVAAHLTRHNGSSGYRDGEQRLLDDVRAFLTALEAPREQPAKGGKRS